MACITTYGTLSLSKFIRIHKRLSAGGRILNLTFLDEYMERLIGDEVKKRC